MTVKFTSQEIFRKYERFARRYDWVEGVPDVLGLSRLRRRLLRRASEKVLEVAVGTGKNLAYYPVLLRLRLRKATRAMPLAISKTFRRRRN